MKSLWRLLLLGGLCCAACRNEGSGPPGPPGPAALPHSPQPVLPAERPAGWQEGAGASRQSAVYAITGRDGALASVSLQILPGQPGGLLRHVNAWRTQLEMPPLDQMTFEQQASWRSTPVGEGLVVELAGTAQGADPALDGATLAVVVEQETHTWFFRLRGNAGLVAAHRDAFLAWVDQVEDSSLRPGPPPVSLGSQNDTLHPGGGPVPTWSPPDGWAPVSPAPGHTAGFLLTGPRQTTGAAAVAALKIINANHPGHVNRWRREAGLPAIRPDNLASVTETVFINGLPLSKVHVAGPRHSRIAVWTPRGDVLWVFSIGGPAALVEAQRPAFAGWIQSVRFPAN